MGVATSYIGFIPDKGIGIALITNASGYSTAQLGQYGLAEMLGEDPESLPYVQRERRLIELEGTYQTYRGTTTVHVRRSGDLLMMEERLRSKTDTTILIPDDLGETRRIFFSLSSGIRTPFEFSLKAGHIECIAERYLFRRMGRKL